MKPLKVRLKKIESLHENLRTDEVEGWMMQLPQVGKGMVISAPPMVKSFDMRLIVTSPVKEINGDIIKTENSIYQLDILEEIPTQEKNPLL